jgi:hypothetical protein
MDAAGNLDTPARAPGRAGRGGARRPRASAAVSGRDDLHIAIS